MRPRRHESYSPDHGEAAGRPFRCGSAVILASSASAGQRADGEQRSAAARRISRTRRWNSSSRSPASCYRLSNLSPTCIWPEPARYWRAFGAR